MNDQIRKGEKPMAGPLDGIRILDMTIGQAGPIAASMLADMGAEVIKLEDTRGGDKARFLTAMHGRAVKQNYYFENNNRNKRSLKIDLKIPESKTIIHKLLETHDVFVTNYREKAVKKLGMDYASLSAKCPHLIYAMGYGWGKEGPDAHKPALDIAAQARGGIWSVSGQPDLPPPMIGSGMADQVAAGMLAYGIMLALFNRERTGMGQEVNTSLLGSQVWLGSLQLQAYLYFGINGSPIDRNKANNPLWNIYRCKDGKWLVLAMMSSDPYWHEFCKAVGIEHLENDDKFKKHRIRTENAKELIEVLDERFSSQDRTEWIQRFNDTGLIWSWVNDYEGVASDPQVLANDYIIDFDHPTHGPVKMSGFPVQLSRTPGALRRHAPEYGEHNEEILRELGYSWEEIEKLVIDEIV